MNRQIKFRVWDKVNNEIRYDVESIVFARNGEPCAVDIGFSRTVAANGDHPQVLLMQFTGLNDSSGKEIYDGDIIELLPKNSMICAFDCSDPSPLIKIVSWDIEYGKWGWLQIDGKKQETGFVFCKENSNEMFKIIGNKFENPELLEVKS